MDDKELLERLRDVEEVARAQGNGARVQTAHDAAARITALAEENERLREALVEARKAAISYGGGLPVVIIDAALSPRAPIDETRAEGGA